MNVAKFLRNSNDSRDQRFKKQGKNVQIRSSDADPLEVVHLSSDDDESNTNDDQPEEEGFVDDDFKMDSPNTKKRISDKTCAVCNEVFNLRVDLIKHAKEFHPNGKPFKCLRCGKLCCSVQALSRHMTKHRDLSEQIKCKVCCKVFTHLYLLKKHMKLHEKDPEISYNLDDTEDLNPPEKHVCEYCMKTFAKGHNLKIHLRIHTGERPYSCSMCEKAFKQPNALKKHRESHFRKLEKKKLKDKATGDHTNSEDLYENNLSIDDDDNKDIEETEADLNSFNSNNFGSFNEIEHFIFGSSEQTEKMYENDDDDDDDEMLLKEQEYEMQEQANTDVNKREINFTTIDNKCAVCQMAFTSKSYLLNHATICHPNEKALKCRECNMCFYSLSSIKSHRRAIHKEKKYVCEFCQKRFGDKGKLNIHMRVHTKERPFACDLCNKTYIQLGHLNYHRKSHFKDKYSEGYIHEEDKDKDKYSEGYKDKYSEGYKDKYSEEYIHDEDDDDDDNNDNDDERNDIVKPVEIITGFEYPTFLNEDITPEDTSLNYNHDNGEEIYSNNEVMQVQNNGEIFKIQYIDEDKSNEYTEDADQQFEDVIPNINEEDFKLCENKCAICQKLFSTENNLMIHAKAFHLNGKPIKCRECKKCFRTVWPLRHHFMYAHNALPKRYNCEFCPKAFCYPADLKIHLRTHTGERPFICNICGKSYQRGAELYRHQQAHNSKAPVESFDNETNLLELVDMTKPNNRIVFKCGCCTKVFKYLLGLEHHARQDHPNAIAIQCPHCNKRFASNHTLSGHLQDHVKNYVENHVETTTVSDQLKKHYCQFCYKPMVRSSDLKRHLRLHTGERPHLCSWCGKSFTQISSVHKHQKTKACVKNVSASNGENDGGGDNIDVYSEIFNPMQSMLPEENHFNAEMFLGTNNVNHHFANPPYIKNEYFRMSNQENRRNVGYMDKQHETLANHCESLNDSEDNSRNYHQDDNTSSNNPIIIKDEIFSDSEDETLNKNNKISKNSKGNGISHQDKADRSSGESTVVVKNEVVSDGYCGLDDLNAQNIIEISQTEIQDDKSYEASHPNIPNSEINKCGVCKRVFQFQLGLTKHAKQYHPHGKAFKCVHCNALYSTALELSHHFEITHNVDNNQVCEFCLKSFERLSELHIHLGTHTGERSFSGTVCEKTLDSHKTTPAGDEAILNRTNDSEADNSSTNINNIKQELYAEGIYEANAFDDDSIRDFSDDRILPDLDESNCFEDSYQENANSDYGACSDEGEMSQPRFKVISTNKYGPPPVDNKCAVCKKIFRGPYHLARHVKKIHPDEKALKCIHCDSVFSRIPTLKEHFRKAHKPKTYVREHHCQFCEKFFIHRSALKVHLRVHTGERPYACSMCDKTFKQLGSLQHHERWHIKMKSKYAKKKKK